jgi:thiamine-phosphate pyrophosphorylase
VILPTFYPILDTATAERFRIHPMDAAEQIVHAGARILQFRHKTFWSREIVEMMERIAAVCRKSGVLFIVNDRVDLARLAGAGVHLGQEDLLPSNVRPIVGPRTPIGFSTHNKSQLLAAAEEPADYLALGPIFSTGSKENPDPVVGIDGLRLLRPLTSRPLVAIGGITRVNAAEVLAAGADSVAVIGDLFPDVRSRAEDWVILTKTR